MESRLLRMVYISVNLLYVYCSLNMVIRRIPIIQKFNFKIIISFNNRYDSWYTCKWLSKYISSKYHYTIDNISIVRWCLLRVWVVRFGILLSTMSWVYLGGGGVTHKNIYEKNVVLTHHCIFLLHYWIRLKQK